MTRNLLIVVVAGFLIGLVTATGQRVVATPDWVPPSQTFADVTASLLANDVRVKSEMVGDDGYLYIYLEDAEGNFLGMVRYPFRVSRRNVGGALG